MYTLARSTYLPTKSTSIIVCFAHTTKMKMKATGHHFHFHLSIRLDHFKTPPSLADAALPTPSILGRLLGRLQKNDNINGRGGRVNEVFGGLVRVGDSTAAGRSFVVRPAA